MTELLGIILFVFVLISNRSLANRVGALEKKVKDGGFVPAVKKAVESHVPTPDLHAVVEGGMTEYVREVVAVTAAKPVVTEAVKTPEPLETFGTWLKEDWLMKLGAFLFIIGCGWFVSYAFANNWIGPVGRITIGICAGALVMAFGYWRMLRYPQQGGVFLALGAGMVTLSIFAGRSVYGFFTPASAILFDFVIAAFVSFASYQFKLRSLAIFAQVLAYAAPILVAGSTDSLFLFTYLLVISLASLILAAVTGWRGTILTSLIFVGLYSLPYILAGGGEYSSEAPVVLNFAYVFAMLYLFSGMVAVIRKGVVEVKKEIVLALLNGALLFLWIYNVAGAEWQTLLFAAWAIVFAVGSFVAYRFSTRLDPFYAYGSVAVAYIAAATAAQLSGAALTIALTIEVCLVVMVVLALTKNTQAATTTSFLFVAPVIGAFASMTRYLYADQVFTADMFVLLVLAFALIVAGRMIGISEKEQGKVNSEKFWIALIIFGTTYIWFVLWCFMHHLMPEAQDLATFFTLAIYTLAGVWAYFVGLAGGDTARRVYGAALLIFVVIRLLFVDVWNMALSGRVITFFGIGILLMATAFLTKRNKPEARPV